MHPTPPVVTVRIIFLYVDIVPSLEIASRPVKVDSWSFSLSWTDENLTGTHEQAPFLKAHRVFLTPSALYTHDKMFP